MKQFPPNVTLQDIATKCRGMRLRWSQSSGDMIVNGYTNGTFIYLTPKDNPLMDVQPPANGRQLGWYLHSLTDRETNIDTFNQDDIDAIIDRLNGVTSASLVNKPEENSRLLYVDYDD